LDPVVHDVSQSKFGETTQRLADFAPDFLKVGWSCGDLANDGWSSAKAKCCETATLWMRGSTSTSRERRQ